MKKRIWLLAILICLLSGLLALPAAAEDSVTNAAVYATINANGDALVSLTITLHLDEGDDSLTFPLPAGATDITVDGGTAITSRSSSSVDVNLARVTSGLPGDFTIRFDYTLNNVVTATEKRTLELNLPLISGFSLPISSVSYVITMPGEVSTNPSFSSTYRQNTIAADMTNTIKGNMITGSVTNGLNDHESLSMTLAVSQELFPSVSISTRTGNPELVPMLIVLGVALLYWLLFLRTLPPAKEKCTLPPEGITAGEVNCRLTLDGANLSLLVFSWAQLGYLIIQSDGKRVLLHKRMDMGNERSLFEVRIFRELFGNRRVVDCFSTRYARLCQRTAAMLPGEKAMSRSRPIHRQIFRTLGLISQSICGVCMAMNLTTLTALNWILSLALIAVGAALAWRIQAIAFSLFRRGMLPIWIGIACGAIWLGLGAISGIFWIALGSVAAQLIIGFLAAYGGRRTELNKTQCAQLYGLRRYMRQLSKKAVTERMKEDPEYFFRLAPYAMALGVLPKFSEAFGRRKLPQCPYLVTRVHGKRTAAEWAEMLDATLTAMDAHYHQLDTERYMAMAVRLR